MYHIEIKNISKSFKGQAVLEEICLGFEYGKIYGLIGHNGSGKSVLMKIICGLMTPDRGIVVVNNRIIGKDVDFPEKIGAVIERYDFNPYTSGFNNLKYLANINKRIDIHRVKDAMRDVGLDPESKKWVYKYSLGMKQRLSLAQAFMEEPELLILDEPMNGLDSEGVKLIRDYLLNLKKQGKTIVLSSHYIEDIDFLCDRIIKLENGRIVSDEINE